MSAKVTSDWTREKHMRRLLRHEAVEEYYKDGGWTTNPEEAKDFSDALEVAETCALFHLEDVELALRLDWHAGDVFRVKIR